MRDYKKFILESLVKVVLEHGYQASENNNRDISERALVHRLAYHLEVSDFFNGYHIDCEYNRQGDDIKRGADGNIFIPDIVIHVRGNDKNNLIMIEAKKFNDPEEEINMAKKKLKDRSDEYGYQYAFFVTFPEREIAEDSIIKISNP